MEQTTPDSVGPSAATLSFTREADRVTGVMRTEGQEFPLFEVRQAGSEVTFFVVIPGTPYRTIVYRGIVTDDRLELAGVGEQQAAYALSATRQGSSLAAAPAPGPAPADAAFADPAPMPQVALAPPPPAPVPDPSPRVQEAPARPQVALAPPPPPPVAAPSPPQPEPAPPMPRVALAPPPPPPPVAATPRVPEPSQPAAPPGAAASIDAGDLQGTWVVQLTDSGSTAPIRALLIVDGDKGNLRVGMEDLPLYEVTRVGADLAFSVIVPGTPYMTVRFNGIAADGMMQLSSLDEGRGVSTLQGRRVDDNVMPAAGPSPPMQASLPPPAAARPATSPRAPSPASARPLAQPPTYAAGPPAKLQLPVLRDLPPNGLLMTPPMGWSSRQRLGPETDDAAIRQAVEGLVESGLHLIGYHYVEVGDGWQGARDTEGVLHPNERFPDMKALGDYIHSQGLKFGLTTSLAPKSCNGMEGSYGFEAQDARAFAEWGVDYVVVEWCGAEGIYSTQEDMRAAFQLMGESLRATGRDIVYGISQKGQYAVEQWGARTGANLWRTTPTEIDENWTSIAAASSAQIGKEAAAKPGSWNDPGLLQAGNSGLTLDEARTQFNLWTVLAAPLMLGNDVRIMMRETVALLGNREVIAVNQDKLGRQGKRVAQSGETQVWARPLADGSIAVAFINTGATTASATVTWEQLGIEGPRVARDLWWHENVGTPNNNYRVVLAGRTSMLVKLSRP